MREAIKWEKLITLQEQKNIYNYTEEELQKRAYKKISVTKAIELYQTILNQPIEVREALFNALGRDLNDEVRGD